MIFILISWIVVVIYLGSIMPVNPIATTTSFVQKGHCNSPLCISSVVLKMLYFHFLWVSPLLQNDSVCNIHIQYYSCIQSVFGSGLLPPLVGLPVYVMAVNEPIMRPSSEEVLLCEPQSEAGLSQNTTIVIIIRGKNMAGSSQLPLTLNHNTLSQLQENVKEKMTQSMTFPSIPGALVWAFSKQIHHSINSQ